MASAMSLIVISEYAAGCRLCARVRAAGGGARWRAVPRCLVEVGVVQWNRRGAFWIRLTTSATMLYACPVGDWRAESAKGARAQLRCCAGGRSEVGCARSEGRRGRRVDVFGVGHVFPIVSNLRRTQEAQRLLPASPGHALSGGRNGRYNGRYRVTHNTPPNLIRAVVKVAVV